MFEGSDQEVGSESDESELEEIYQTDDGYSDENDQPIEPEPELEPEVDNRRSCSSDFDCFNGEFCSNQLQKCLKQGELKREETCIEDQGRVSSFQLQ